MLATAARTSQVADQQLDLYQRAIDSLEQDPLGKVEYMIEFAEWLYRNGYPLQDAEDQIQVDQLHCFMYILTVHRLHWICF